MHLIYWGFVATLIVLQLLGTIAISWWWIVGLVLFPPILAVVAFLVALVVLIANER